MTHEFDHVRAAFAASTSGRVVAGMASAMASAWRTSRLGSARAIADGWRLTPAPMLIRPVAIAGVAAAGMQPLLMWMMPGTVKPAMPAAAFIAIALLAVAAAWRPDAIAASWPESRFARWLRR